MNTAIFVKRMESQASADVSEDIILPDYQPEVRRIVGVQAAVTADGKYLSGDTLEADGDVTYTVLYTTPEGTLTHFSETTAYTGHIPIKTEEDRFGSTDIVLSASAENVNCRVTAPRRITLSSRVKLTALAEKAADTALRVENPAGEEEQAVRRRISRVQTACMTEIRRSGEVSGELREREDCRLLCASASLCFGDVRMTREKNSRSVQIKGDAFVSALFQGPEGSYFVSKSRAPLEESIPVPDGVREDERICPAAFGKVVLLEMEGEGVYTWKTSYDIDCVLVRASEAEITEDAYLTGQRGTVTMREMQNCIPAAAANTRLTLSASVPLRSGASYVTAWGTGSVERVQHSSPGARMQMQGNIRLSVVTVSGDEFFLDETVVPLRCEMDALTEELPGTFVGRADVQVADITARPEGDSLSLSAELALTAALLGEENLRAAVLLTPDAEGKIPHKKNRITVYIPDEGESGWEVEKRFLLGREAVRDGEAYVI